MDANDTGSRIPAATDLDVLATVAGIALHANLARVLDLCGVHGSVRRITREDLVRNGFAWIAAASEAGSPVKVTLA